MLVTASVDAIRMRGPPVPIDRDVTVTGRVVFTGRSSLDILMLLRSVRRVARG